MIIPVRNTYPNLHEDARRWALAAIKTVRIVRAIVVDKCGEVGHYAPLTKIQGVSARLRLGRRREILNMRKSLWITLAVLLLAIGPPAARADTVTLDYQEAYPPTAVRRAQFRAARSVATL